jgi:hypothetical protein
VRGARVTRSEVRGVRERRGYVKNSQVYFPKPYRLSSRQFPVLVLAEKREERREEREQRTDNREERRENREERTEKREQRRENREIRDSRTTFVFCFVFPFARASTFSLSLCKKALVGV